MTIAQKRAISYAITAKANERRERFIIEKDGSMDGFKKSKYKSMYWYIRGKYGLCVY